MFTTIDDPNPRPRIMLLAARDLLVADGIDPPMAGKFILRELFQKGFGWGFTGSVVMGGLRPGESLEQTIREMWDFPHGVVFVARLGGSEAECVISAKP